VLQNAVESALLRLAYSDVYEILRPIHALQRVAVCCSILKCVLQCVLQSILNFALLRLAYNDVYEILNHIHALQRVAVCCRVCCSACCNVV